MLDEVGLLDKADQNLEELSGGPGAITLVTRSPAQVLGRLAELDSPGDLRVRSGMLWDVQLRRRLALR